MQNIKKIPILLLVILLLAIFINSSFAFTEKLSDRDDVKNFINTMVIKYNFDKKDLTKLLDNTTPLADVLNKIQHPYEEEPWYKYRNIFLTQERINKGVKYWQEHRHALKFAEHEYGVPASIIVAIIGVETLYGNIQLKYPVLNSLVTLSFYYPPRAKFFQSELEQYLLLTRELQIDPRTMKGSYAGAIGLPQFMPSNYRQYALSYSDDAAHADITQDTDDVIISVANFLSCFGWQEFQPVAAKAKIRGTRYKELLTDGLKPTLSIKQLKKYGVKPQWYIPNNYPAKLLRFEHNENSYEYWLGLQNFYVLSHYNSSKQYILAVYQLSEKLKEKYFR